MAICKWCDQEMTAGSTVSCEDNESIEIGGRDCFSIRFMPKDLGRCHDCNVAPNGFHHPGCDMERCPACGGQLISCGCLDDVEDGE